MPIFKKVEAKRKDGTVTTANVPVPDFTYTNACLAQMIVDAWTHPKYKAALLERETDGITITRAAAKLATDSVNSCGFNLERAVVISEAELYAPPDGYQVQTDNEIVFVLPDQDRVRVQPSGTSLLQTAELLMATTPNGI
jgi:hypothetical protein